MRRCGIRFAARMSRKEALQVLGLGPKTSKEEAKQAFRGAALQWHPDVNSSSDAAARFQRSRSALEVLAGDREKRFGPLLRPRAEHGDSHVAMKAEELGLRRGVLLTAEQQNTKVRANSVVLVLSIGNYGDRGILLNSGKSGSGGPDEVLLQTVLHRCPELAEQGPVTDDESLFAECFLAPAAAKELQKRLIAAHEPYVSVFGHLRWGP